MVAASQPALASQILTDLITMAIGEEVKQTNVYKKNVKNVDRKTNKPMVIGEEVKQTNLQRKCKTL